ncbi:MAG: transcriptional regulator [Planctomycetota bacterium]
MHHVKRIEIVIDKPHVSDVKRLLDRLGVPGITILDTLAGYGDRGTRSGGDVSDAQVNSYIITTCAPDKLDDLTASIEPLLRRFGGLCLISDASVIRKDA